MRGEEGNQLDEEGELLQRRLAVARKAGITGLDGEGPLSFETKRLLAEETPPSGTINFLLNDMTCVVLSVRQLAD